MAKGTGDKSAGTTRKKASSRKITTSSTAEYFAKNLQQVGFSSPTKAVLTTLKEAVDNALSQLRQAYPEAKLGGFACDVSESSSLQDLWNYGIKIWTLHIALCNFVPPIPVRWNTLNGIY